MRNSCAAGGARAWALRAVFSAMVLAAGVVPAAGEKRFADEDRDYWSV